MKRNEINWGFDIPEGWSVDLERSDLANGRVCMVEKPDEVKKEIDLESIKSYSDVVDVLSCLNPDPEYLWDGVQFYSHGVSRSLGALYQLVNTAAVLNGDWDLSPDAGGLYYVLSVDADPRQRAYIYVDSVASDDTSPVVFKSHELAKQAISILGTSVIVDALSLYRHCTLKGLKEG